MEAEEDPQLHAIAEVGVAVPVAYGPTTPNDTRAPSDRAGLGSGRWISGPAQPGALGEQLVVAQELLKIGAQELLQIRKG